MRSAAGRCAASARSPSALFTTMRSASSMIPRLMPCSSSPPVGDATSTKRSTSSATATSDWPTPTVSTSTTSKPAASQSSTASRVRRATPPSVPLVGEGRMYASGWRPRSAMRVLSPRIEPPLRWLDGSTASTATWWPASMACRPSASMNVDFPAPGAPETPTRDGPRRWPAAARRAAPRASAAVVGAGRLDQRDRPGERAPVAGPHGVSQRRVAHRGHASERFLRIRSRTLPAASGMLVPGPKMATTPASCRKA